MKLTLEAARALQPGQMIRCHVVRGLQLRAGARGKSWLVYYWHNGKVRRPKIGDFPAVSIERAREAAKDVLARVAKGADPSAERKALRAAPTVADLFAIYEAETIARKYKPRTAEGARSAWRRHILPAIGGVRVAELSVSHVNALLERVGAGAPVAANRVRAYLSAALNLAESDARRWRPKGSNPCRDHETVSFRERKRRVFVKAEEFAAVHAELQRLATAAPWGVAAIYTILYAGARVTEIATARTDELVIDADGARIVRHDHKTADFVDVRTIRLPAQAARLLASLPAHRSGYLFGPIGELAEPRRAIWELWDAARKLAGAPHVQVRDLRRTFATVAKSRGIGLDQIGDIFDHRNRQTTLRYAYLFDDAAGAAVQETGDAIQAMLEAPKR